MDVQPANKSQQRFAIVGLVALGLLVAANAVVGPLVLGLVRFHVSASAEAQLIGGEVVSLLLVAPIAVAAGVLWARGNPIAPVLALGPALYSLYMYVQYVVGPQYERYPGNNEYLFPLYLAIIVLAWSITAAAWRELGAMRLRALLGRARLILALLLLVLNVTFALAWVSSILAVLTGPQTTATWREYSQDQTLFWLIRMMDLGFVIPASLVVAFGLLRRAAWATRLAYAFVGFQTLIVAAAAGMAIMMAVRSDLAASPVLLVVTSVLTLTLGCCFGMMLRGL